MFFRASYSYNFVMPVYGRTKVVTSFCNNRKSPCRRTIVDWPAWPGWGWQKMFPCLERLTICCVIVVVIVIVVVVIVGMAKLLNC